MEQRNGGVLITGGTGFLGRAIAKALLADETATGRVCIYSRGEHAQAAMYEELGRHPRLRMFIGDVRDQERLCWAMRSVETVIHAAALKRIEVGDYCPEEMIKTNVIGAMNMVEAARLAGVSKVLLVSTDKAVEPISPYGQSKALAESLFLRANDPQQGPRFAVARYGNVWGSTGSVVPTWREIIKKGRPVPVTDPAATRFFMTINGAVSLVLGTAGKMTGGEIAIPTLPAYSVGDLAAAMGAEMDIRGLPAYEKMHESMVSGSNSADARRMSQEELREALCAI